MTSLQCLVVPWLKSLYLTQTSTEIYVEYQILKIRLYDRKPPFFPWERILKAVGVTGNYFANIDYGLHISMKQYLENYNPNSNVKSEVVKDGLEYF